METAVVENNLEEVATAPQATGESLQEWAARRRQDLAAQPERAIFLPLPGYEERLAVQYRPLTYREAVKIETRHEKNRDDAEKLLFVAADKLIAACERIVEPNGPDEYKDTGYRFNAKAAAELFGCGDVVSSRQALLAIFDDEEAVVRHHGAYEEQRTAANEGVTRLMVGESGAGEA